MRIWGQSRVYGMRLSLFIHLIVPGRKKADWDLKYWCAEEPDGGIGQTNKQDSIGCDGSVSNLNSRSKSSPAVVKNVSDMKECLLRGCLRGPLGCLDAVYLFAPEGPHLPESTSWERALASKGTLWKEMFTHKSPWDCMMCHWTLVSQSQVNIPVCTNIPHGDAIWQTCSLPNLLKCKYVSQLHTLYKSEQESWHAKFSRTAKRFWFDKYLVGTCISGPPRPRDLLLIRKVSAPSL